MKNTIYTPNYRVINNRKQKKSILLAEVRWWHTAIALMVMKPVCNKGEGPFYMSAFLSVMLQCTYRIEPQKYIKHLFSHTVKRKSILNNPKWRTCGCNTHTKAKTWTRSCWGWGWLHGCIQSNISPFPRVPPRSSAAWAGAAALSSLSELSEFSAGPSGAD